MIKEATYKKIREIESKYGSLVHALELNVITNSTYYRWRSISMTKGYIDFIKKNPVSFHWNL